MKVTKNGNVLRIEEDQQVENIMVWVDGKLAGTSYDAWLTKTKPYSEIGNLCKAEANSLEITLTYPAVKNKIKVDTFDSRGNFLNTKTISYVDRNIKNTFIRTIFGAHLKEIKNTKGLKEALKAAGVNTIFTAVASRESEIFSEVKEFAEKEDFLILGDGMDWMFPIAVHNPDLNISGCIGIDWCDETGFRLTEKDVPLMLELNALAKKNGVPSCWTTGPGTTLDSGPRWNEALCDYLSLGSDCIDWRTFRKAGEGIGQWGTMSVEQNFRALKGCLMNKYTRKDCPILVNTSGCGGVDIPDYYYLANIGFAVTLGATGIKLYHLQTKAWEEEKVQIGISVGSSRWEAMSHAFNTIAEFEKIILGPGETSETDYFSIRKWPLLKIAVNKSEDKSTYGLVSDDRGFILTPKGKIPLQPVVPAGCWVVIYKSVNSSKF